MPRDAAYVHELFHSLHISGFWQRRAGALSRDHALGSFQHSDALHTQSFHRNVRHRVVAGNGGYPDSDAVGVCILQLQAEAG